MYDLFTIGFAESRIFLYRVLVIFPFAGYNGEGDFNASYFEGLPMDETELQECIQYIRSKYSDRIIDKIFLNADDDSVSVRCEYHVPKPVAKMSGYYIGDPSSWNKAKQAEFRDSLPNPL